MKILIVDTYYPQFLASIYEAIPELTAKPYAEQLGVLLSQCFGTSDFYSRHLKDQGHETRDIIANCVPLQQQWAKENKVAYSSVASRISPKWQRLPIVGRWLSASKGLLSILIRQIETTKPDVLYLQNMSVIPPHMLKSLKKKVRLVVGQIACPLPPKEYIAPYDLILSSFPHYVERFRRSGIASEYFRIAFDPIVLERLGQRSKQYNITFVGGISSSHGKAMSLLEHVARHSEIQFFGYGKDALSPASPICKVHHGEVWGLDMYRTLAESRITLNRHIDVAENFANNMRLFEATGCGAMLLTDFKDNLNQLFEVGKEVVCYRSPEEAVELINYYVSHPEEAHAIATAGQRRTLKDHTYRLRMEELGVILTKHLRKTSS